MVVLDPGAESRLGEFEPDGRDIVIVVGPEGGVSPAELSRLTAAGASVWNLGQNVLRTSTAGPAAIAVLNTRLGRW
jgi:16S rRNA (uracil1498-N3)-methyltransferase